MSDPTLSEVRRAFRDALSQIRSYPVDMDWRPAFMAPVTTLDLPRRSPLPDGQLRPTTPPFAGQKLTIADAQRRLAAGSLSAREVAQLALDAIQSRQAELNAYVYSTPADALLAQADALDADRRAGKTLPTLHGITIGVKDLLEVDGMPNTASSPVLADFVSTRDSGAVRLLKNAGVLITGKTHTHEFALGVTTPQSRNPWDATRDPGGSSGGSAIAVATGMSLGAMATDTRASVRVPASLCGIVGYKPTFGIVPGDGVTMLSWSLDHIAPMAATVEDVAILLNALVPQRTEDFTRARQKDVRGLTVGLPVAALEGADPEVVRVFQNSVDALKASGVRIVEVDTPSAADFDLAMLMGLVISRCEAAAYHTAFANLQREYDLKVVTEQMDEASRVTAIEYLQAQRARADLRQRMLANIANVDALLMPTTRVAAPKSAEVDQYFLVLSQNCILWSFIGFPALSVPCGWTANGLPVGAQLVAGPLEDGRLLAVASALETTLAGV